MNPQDLLTEKDEQTSPRSSTNSGDSSEFTNEKHDCAHRAEVKSLRQEIKLQREESELMQDKMRA